MVQIRTQGRYPMRHVIVTGKLPIWGVVLYWAFSGISLSQAQPRPVDPRCTPSNTVFASVVALNQPFMWNRLGAAEPQGMMFALASDVVATGAAGQFQPGKVRLRDAKRPRPIVLRVNVGSCLKIQFQNLLDPGTPTFPNMPDYLIPANLAVNTTVASMHLTGLDLLGTIKSDGTWAGATSRDDSGLADP